MFLLSSCHFGMHSQVLRVIVNNFSVSLSGRKHRHSDLGYRNYSWTKSTNLPHPISSVKEHLLCVLAIPSAFFYRMRVGLDFTLSHAWIQTPDNFPHFISQQYEEKRLQGGLVFLHFCHPIPFDKCASTISSCILPCQ